MAWALDVAWNSNDLGGSGTTITFTYGSAVASGALLVCFVGGEPASIGSISVSDDVNGAWSQFSGSPVTTGSQDWIWAAFYRMNSGAGTPTITATYNASSSGRGIVAGSYTGIATASAFDVGTGQGQMDPGTGTDFVSNWRDGFNGDDERTCGRGHADADHRHAVHRHRLDAAAQYGGEHPLQRPR